MGRGPAVERLTRLVEGARNLRGRPIPPHPAQRRTSHLPDEQRRVPRCYLRTGRLWNTAGNDAANTGVRVDSLTTRITKARAPKHIRLTFSRRKLQNTPASRTVPFSSS